MLQWRLGLVEREWLLYINSDRTCMGCYMACMYWKKIDRIMLEEIEEESLHEQEKLFEQ